MLPKRNMVNGWGSCGKTGSNFRVSRLPSRDFHFFYASRNSRDPNNDYLLIHPFSYILFSQFQLISHQSIHFFTLKIKISKKSSNFVAEINVERFGLLATTEKNAKLQLIFCALQSPSGNFLIYSQRVLKHYYQQYCFCIQFLIVNSK